MAPRKHVIGNAGGPHSAPTTPHIRNKSVKSTARSSLLTQLTRNLDNNYQKTVKRDSTTSNASSTGLTIASSASASAAAAAADAAAAEADAALQTTSDGMIYNGNEDKPWSCKVCKREYKWKNSLNCHIKNECGKPPKFFCARNCGYKTNINSNMKRHMNSNCKPRFTI